MQVAEIWRYPVKSMAGERLTEASLSTSGIKGDRVVQVHDGSGRLVTARTHPALLRHRGTLGPRGEPLVDGRPWTDRGVLADIRRIVGPGAELVRDDALDRFDVLPLLVATDGAIAAFGRDGRRLRPNIVIGGVPGLYEREWPRSDLRIGDVLIRLEDLRGRCVMTTFDPDTTVQDAAVLKDIVRRFGGKLALNADVIRGGSIQVAQLVDLIRLTGARPTTVH
jgi:uncharacterized protein